MSHSMQHNKQRSISLFGPIVLIAIGLFFLFSRLNPVQDLYWLDALRLWPLLLIFIGLNILVLQAPRPYASILSGIIAIIAVVMGSWLLIADLIASVLAYRLDPRLHTAEETEVTLA